MGERKVLNKYYPPDFDPAKIPRRRQPKNLQIKVRMMLPMSIQCNTCGNYIYKGTKFNSRKEDCVGETYLGIQILRFYFKCSKCSAELTMKTDPQNSDYTMESGATRNYEPWRATDEAVEGARSKREAEEMGDAMKALENRTLDSKQEMDIMAALDEMKSMKARHAGVGTAEMLSVLHQTRAEREKALDEEDEALLRSVVFQSSEKFYRRSDVDDDEFEEEELEEYDFNVEQGRQGSKRMKVDSLDTTGTVIEASQAVSTAVESTLGTGDRGQQANRKAILASPQIFIKPKPVKFSIKPKVSEPPAEVKIEEKQLAVSVMDNKESVDLEEKENQLGLQENMSSISPAPSTGLAALCSTYDSSDSE